MSKAKPRLPTLSKSLKAGPTAMQKVLKQRREVVIYENKQQVAVHRTLQAKDAKI